MALDSVPHHCGTRCGTGAPTPAVRAGTCGGGRPAKGPGYVPRGKCSALPEALGGQASGGRDRDASNLGTLPGMAGYLQVWVVAP